MMPITRTMPAITNGTTSGDLVAVFFQSCSTGHRELARAVPQSLQNFASLSSGFPHDRQFGFVLAVALNCCASLCFFYQHPQNNEQASIGYPETSHAIISTLVHNLASIQLC